MRSVSLFVMRATPFVLVALVFVIACGGFLTARVIPNRAATAGAAAKSSAFDAATPLPGGAIAAAQKAETSPVSLANAQVALAAAPAAAPSTANTCIRGANGAVSCGTVVNDKPAPNPFDQPAAALPMLPGPAPVHAKPVKHHKTHEVDTRGPAPRHINLPPLRKQAAHSPQHPAAKPPSHEVARKDERQWHPGRDRWPPPPSYSERRPPTRYGSADLRRYDSTRALPSPQQTHLPAQYRADRALPPPRNPRERAMYLADLERRTVELEHELRALRAGRDAALRQAERRVAGGAPYAKPPTSRVVMPRRGGQPAMPGKDSDWQDGHDWQYTDDR